MVRVRCRLNENLEWNDVPLGVTSNDFNKRFGHEVVTTKPGKYAIEYGDGVTGVYASNNLRYGEVGIGGKTLTAPQKGLSSSGSEGNALAVEFRVKAKDFVKTARTKSDKDNARLFESLLDGNDDFRLGGGDDIGDMLGGNDMVRAGGGDDFINGSRGRDRLCGEGDDVSR